MKEELKTLYEDIFKSKQYLCWLHNGHLFYLHLFGVFKMKPSFYAEDGTPTLLTDKDFEGEWTEDKSLATPLTKTEFDCFFYHFLPEFLTPPTISLFGVKAETSI